MAFKEKVGEAFVTVPVNDQEFQGFVDRGRQLMQQFAEDVEGFGNTFSKVITLPVIGGLTAAISTILSFRDVAEGTFEAIDISATVLSETITNIPPVVKEAVSIIVTPLEKLLSLTTKNSETARDMKLEIEDARKGGQSFSETISELARDLGLTGKENQKLIAGFGVLAATIGPLSIVFGKFVDVIQAAATPFNLLGQIIGSVVATLKSGLVITRSITVVFSSLVTVTATLVAMFTNFLAIIGLVPIVLGSITAGFAKLLDVEESTALKLGGLVTVISLAVGALSSMLGTIGGVITNLNLAAVAIGLASGNTFAFIGALSLLSAIAIVIGGAILAIVGALVDLEKWGRKADTLIRENISKKWPDVFQTIGKTIETLKDGFKNVVDFWVKTLNEGGLEKAWDKTLKALASLPDIIWADMKSSFESGRKKVMKEIKKLREDAKSELMGLGIDLVWGSIIPDMVSDIIGEFSGMSSGILEKLKELSSGNKSIWESIKSKTKDAAEFIKSNFGSTLGDAKGTVKSKFTKKLKKFDVPLEDIKTAWAEFQRFIEASTTELNRTIERTFQNMNQSISRSFADMLTTAKFNLKSLLNIVKRTVQKILAEIIRITIVKKATSGLQSFVKGALSGLSSGASSSSGGSSGFGIGTKDRNQHGGLAREGQPTLVGEGAGDSTEVFLPPTDGRILSNKEIGEVSGGSGPSGLVLTIKDETDDNVEVSDPQQKGPNKMVDVILNNAAQNIAQNGTLGQAIQNTFGLTRKGSRRT